MHFVKCAVTNSTGINENDRVLCRVEILQYDINCIVLVLGIILRFFQINRRLQTLSIDFLLDHICRESNVHRSTLDPALAERMVDQDGSFICVFDLRHDAGDACAHLRKDVEITIAKRVMKEHGISLRDGAWLTDDVDDRNVL